MGFQSEIRGDTAHTHTHMKIWLGYLGIPTYTTQEYEPLNLASSHFLTSNGLHLDIRIIRFSDFFRPSKLIQKQMLFQARTV